MASHRQRRRHEKVQRHTPKPVRISTLDDVEPAGRVERLVYSRQQAAEALGVSLATLDRYVIPAIATIKTEWGTRLIPKGGLDRYVAEHTEEPRSPGRRRSPSGRRSTLPPEVVARIRRERAEGRSLAAIADRLNRDGIPTGQGGRQWWPSTVRSVLVRFSPARRDSRA